MLALLMALLLAPGAAAAGCEELNGKYAGVESAEYSSDFSRLEFSSAEGRAEIALWPVGSAMPRRMSLSLDGKAHEGDGAYTGLRYHAACEGESLFVEAEFEGRADRVLYLFFRDGEEVQLINAHGDYARVTGRFRQSFDLFGP